MVGGRETWNCSHCLEVWYNKDEFHRHVRDKHKGMGFKCKFCTNLYGIGGQFFGYVQGLELEHHEGCELD